MNIQTCIQYLNFVANECDRILRDRSVSDEELNDLIIEFRRFQEKVKTSELADDVKSKIAEIQFNYSIKSVNQNHWTQLAGFATFGLWGGIFNYRQQQKRNEAIGLLHLDVSRLAGELKWNC